MVREMKFRTAGRIIAYLLALLKRRRKENYIKTRFTKK